METVAAERAEISGLVLHVDEYGEQAPETLVFHKDRSRTITVGRKSSAGSGSSQGAPTDTPDDPQPQRALFRCPVVSRKHAKITFTEYGNAYITDLHSHHGTHILRPGELVSTSLKPEVPTVLADGDLITFGKSVGRDSYLVRPVVARTELVFGGDAPAQAHSPPSGLLDALHDPYTPSMLDPEDIDGHISDGDDDGRASARPISGRYGVFLPSPESSPSSSDGDSDIQEISPSSSPQELPSIFFKPFPGVSSGRMRLLQQFLPPIHPMHTPLSMEDYSLPFSFPPAQLPFTPLEDDMEIHHDFEHENEHEHEDEEEEEEDMDLSSSRSSSPEEEREPSVVPEEPPLVGAYPSSPERPSTPHEPCPPPMHLREIIVISDDDAGSLGSASAHASVSPEADGDEEVSGESVREEAQAQAMDVVYGLAESVVEVQTPVVVPPEPEHDHVEVTEIPSIRCTHSCTAVAVDVRALNAQVAETSNELNALRAARTTAEVVFGMDMEQTKARLNTLGARVEGAHTSLAAHNGALEDAQARLRTLGAAVADLHRRAELAEGLDALTKEVDTAKDMLLETCALQWQTREQMVEELEAVKALREEAAATVAQARLALEAQAEAAQKYDSLKRKRDDAGKEEAVVEESTLALSTPTLAVQEAPLSKRRRTLQVAATVAHTTAVAAVGAVAAWTALAFS